MNILSRLYLLNFEEWADLHYTNTKKDSVLQQKHLVQNISPDCLTFEFRDLMFILSILGVWYDLHYISAKKDLALELNTQKVDANQVS